MAGTVRSRSLRSEEGDEGDEKGETMTAQPLKLSEIMKEMAERLLRHPRKVPSSEAAHVALMLERPLGEGDSGGVEAWGRITPLADSADLLLEQEGRKGSWSEIARGLARKLIKTVASDTKGTFHGLGALDKALRRAGKGLERLQVKREGTTFVYAESGEVCSPQEALFHY